MRFPQVLSTALVFVSLTALDVSAQTKVKLPADPYATAAALPLTPPVVDGVPVDVVTADNKPVVGVSVLVVDTTQVARKRRMEIGAASREAHSNRMEMSYLYLLCLHGKRFKTDAAGRAMVTRARRGLIVVIQGRQLKSGTFALRSGAEPRRQRMVFTPPAGIDVLVVDDRGKPVGGVPVAIEQSWSHGFGFNLHTQKTAKDGRVRLATTLFRYRGVNADTTYRVVLAIPTGSPSGALVDPANHVNDPNKPIKLVMPKYGQVRVYVTDKDDRPVRGLDRICLQIAKGGEGRTEVYDVKDVVDDYATFPFVEVGVPITVWCDYKGMQRPQRINEHGPRHARELRVLTLKGVTAPLGVRLTVQDAKGLPVASEVVGVLFSNASYFDGRAVKTASDGGLDISMPEQFEESDAGYLTVVRRGTGRTLDYQGAFRVPFEQLRKSGDLGAFKLAEEPLLVRGIAVDASGQPVKDLTISARRSYVQDRMRGSRTSGRSVFFNHSVVTGADGKFELRELSDTQGVVKLSVSSTNQSRQGASAKPLKIVSGAEVGRGQADHKLVIGRASAIRGAMKGLDDKTAFPGRIRILDKDGKSPEGVWFNTRGSGKFFAPNCPPGTYRIEFNLLAQKKPFLVVEDVKVVPAEDCLDPRLQNIDLGKHCKLVTLEVVDEQGKLVRNATLSVTRKDRNGTSTYGVGMSNGKTTLGLPIGGMAAGVDIEVSANSGKYQSVKLLKLDSDRKVVLKSGFLVELRIRNLPKLPGKIVIAARATSLAPGKNRASWFQAKNVSADGSLSFYVSSSGDYELVLKPRVRDRNGRYLSDQKTQPPEFRFEFSVKNPAKGAPTKVSPELEEEDLEILDEFVKNVPDK